MRRPVGVLVAIAIVLFGLELALPSSGHWPPGASAAFGLMGCVVIVAGPVA